jgi:hypothetical protein
MAIAPRYHSVIPTLHHALRMAQHALRFNPANQETREMVTAICATLARVGTEFDQQRGRALLEQQINTGTDRLGFNLALVSVSESPLPLIKSFMGKNEQNDALFMCKLAEIVKERRNKMIESAVKKSSTVETWAVSLKKTICLTHFLVCWRYLHV